MTQPSVSDAKLYKYRSFWKLVTFLITNISCLLTGLLSGCERKNNIFGVNSATNGPKILPRSESSRVGTVSSLVFRALLPMPNFLREGQCIFYI